MVASTGDVTDDGTPPEVNASTIDEVGCSGPSKEVIEVTGLGSSVDDRDSVTMVIADRETGFGRLATSVVVNATMGSGELDSVDNRDEGV